jgi:hypothetical protein
VVLVLFGLDVPLFPVVVPDGFDVPVVAPVVTLGFFVVVVETGGFFFGVVVVVVDFGRDVLPPIVPPPVTPPSCCATATLVEANRKRTVNTNRKRGGHGVGDIILSRILLPLAFSLKQGQKRRKDYNAGSTKAGIVFVCYLR